MTPEEILKKIDKNIFDILADEEENHSPKELRASDSEIRHFPAPADTNNHSQFSPIKKQQNGITTVSPSGASAEEKQEMGE